MKAIKYQIIKVTINNPIEAVNINVNSDRLYKKITGILVTVPYYLSFLSQTTLSLSINDKEVFPDEFEIKLLTCEPSVSTNERFYTLDEEAAGSTIKGKFKDGGPINGVPFPYIANIYLRLEDKA